MKKISSIKIALVAILFAGCAFTDYGNRINDERSAIEDLEHKRDGYESRYVIILNGLEKYPGDPELEKERDQVRKRILELSSSIRQMRESYNQNVQEWEKKIADDKLQKQIMDREERMNAYKKDGDLSP